MEPESIETLVKIQLEIFASSESCYQVSERFFQWFHQTFSISAIFWKLPRMSTKIREEFVQN